MGAGGLMAESRGFDSRACNSLIFFLSGYFQSGRRFTLSKVNCNTLAGILFLSSVHILIGSIVGNITMNRQPKEFYFESLKLNEKYS